MNFDVIIIGGGAAGISAALWCDELGLDALLLESNAELGGQLLWTYNEIKNHLGIEAKNGRELRDVFVKQTEKRNFTARLKTKVSEVNFKRKSVMLETGETLFARAIIVATGVKRRKLNVEGEEKFQNKGIIQSGKRDQDFVEGKTAIIIGGGDAAFENGLILAETAAQVFLVHRGKDFRARKEFVEMVSENPKIEILTETAVTKFIGSEQLEAVELKNLKTNKTQILTTQTILIRIGVAPDIEIFRGEIDLDEQGYIKIDSRCQTSVKGVFAVGDVANPVAPTLSSAVGMGATAAKATFAEFDS
ncbi:MAG TPA: NAD(P)/FAD-dependent oxidoreductase [Pyrinomonadaceae bacterium]|nr:NAD(P)/FAD-dependent oxidoreductase [Pyrinomonadaceae bacterium]